MKPKEYVRKYRRKADMQQLDLVDRLRQLEAGEIEATVPTPPNSRREAEAAKRRRRKKPVRPLSADWQAPVEEPEPAPPSLEPAD